MVPQTLVEQISGLYLGEAVVELGGVSSGINHKVRTRELRVATHAVAGDSQADPKHHGGMERVLHHFPREHYGQYRRWDLMNSFKDAPAMGENISTVGLDETQVNIGDIIKIGEVELQVTQPRSPCFKLNLQFGHNDFALAMQQSGRCGWFYRVLKPGTIYETDSIVLSQRITDISVAEAMHLYFLPEFNAEQYQRLADCEGLAATWVNSLQRRIENRVIEDWQMRLYGPKKP
ncbi:MOSC domain-containing protein [Shewanella schlegeliana]|uniref:MOSC domain-containing protein n=1 Tax=Shewanella schlegeliana TaxID=190308 RepID=A0ABS1T3D9_9GAMM|nr:MOSC domain-containing protein [Shewanella schlegeliana]MBL4914659.1 MOSC domain-containing protein [Shewanella schlegeliana]MCL1110009.1 MOSC domain-containing protein [Shewanella schlegeliana]GIU25239.1 molybdenum cofactor sulfurase [Shewanella schlegeliana]